VPLYDRIADLPIEVSDYVLERHEVAVSSGWVRVSTVVVLRGAGVEGRGEDITYETPSQEAFQAAPRSDVAYLGSFDELSARLAPFGDDYRRWAFESAALDLALRQAGRSLGDVLGREYRPVRFVISTRLDARDWLAVDPQLEFKLDPTTDWSDEYLRVLAASGRVRCLDLKAYYTSTAVDSPPDERLYRACVELFGDDATIEDAWLRDGFGELFHGAEHRLSFDAPIHSVADVEALPVAPQRLNIKPSRFGTARRLLEAIDHCEANGIAMYGGGQFELAVGRAHVQTLASLFYADAPNDVAPSVYNASKPAGGLPRSPLPAPAAPRGLAG